MSKNYLQPYSPHVYLLQLQQLLSLVPGCRILQDGGFRMMTAATPQTTGSGSTIMGMVLQKLTILTQTDIV